MPQTGPDLVGAGYPISNALTALLGGNGNTTQGNVPIHSNLYFGMGGFADTALNAASVYNVAVPVVPGAVVSRISILIGATAGGSMTRGWGALYTGTGSAPGTAGVSPVLIAQTTSGSVVSNQTLAGVTGAGSATTTPVASTIWSYQFATPQTITSSQAPYGFVYAAICGSPQNSCITMTAAAACQYLYYPTSPVAMVATSGSAFVAPATMATATVVAAPPVVLLS